MTSIKRCGSWDTVSLISKEIFSNTDLKINETISILMNQKIIKNPTQILNPIQTQTDNQEKRSTTTPKKISLKRGTRK